MPVVVEKSAVVAPKTPAVFTSDGAAKTEGKQSDKPQGSFFKRLWRGLLWFCDIQSLFYWSSDRISRFRERYEDADLWLFFGFSILSLSP